MSLLSWHMNYIEYLVTNQKFHLLLVNIYAFHRWFVGKRVLLMPPINLDHSKSSVALILLKKPR